MAHVETIRRIKMKTCTTIRQNIKELGNEIRGMQPLRSINTAFSRQWSCEP